MRSPEIPLFNSLSHPTITGGWFGRGIDASFETLAGTIASAGYARACAVGLAGAEGYQHAAFAQRCKLYPSLVPIAGVAPALSPRIDVELDEVVALGFPGIKIHPRLSGCGYGSPELAATLSAAARRRLVVFLCTYFHAPISTYPATDPLFDLVRVLKTVAELRLVLVHGGAVDIMRWMQLASHSLNILLDISHTMMRYQGSSIDLDLKWLFQRFSFRTCFGTDHPEWGHVEVRERFESLAHGADPDAMRRVGGVNLARLLAVELG